MCDVRDVAQAHVRAAQVDEAVGKRIMINSRNKLASLADLAEFLVEAGYTVTKVERIPNESEYASLEFDNTKVKTLLNIELTDLKKSVLDMAESLKKFGIVKN